MQEAESLRSRARERPVSPPLSWMAQVAQRSGVDEPSDVATTLLRGLGDGGLEGRI